MEIEIVCEELDFPEGPIAMADGSVILVEMRRQTLTRVTPDGRREVLCETGGGPNGAAIGPDGAVWICNNGGFSTVHDTYTGASIQRYDLATGELTKVYEACDGVRITAPNDLVFDRQGGFWFTDYGQMTREGRYYGAVLYATPDGSFISRQRGRMLTPNGIGLSPDEATLYVADSEPGRIWACDVVAPGVLAPPESSIPGRVLGRTPGFEILDSMAIEQSGRICAGTLHNGGITVFDPDGSFEHVPLPDMLCTNICFGGSDMRDGWVTAARSGRLLKLRWPRPGLRLNFNA